MYIIKNGIYIFSPDRPWRCSLTNPKWWKYVDFCVLWRTLELRQQNKKLGKDAGGGAFRYPVRGSPSFWGVVFFPGSGEKYLLG